MDYDSEFHTEVWDTKFTRTHICDVCFNVDVIAGPTQLEEANDLHDKGTGYSEFALLCGRIDSGRGRILPNL